MDSFVFLIAFVACIATAQAATVCTNDTVCGYGQCCYIRPQFLVVSRRDALKPVILPLEQKHDTGVCQKYRVLHEHCGPLETANGMCGCGQGMSCQFVPAPEVHLATLPTPIRLTTDLAVSRRRRHRRKIYVPGPGTFQCEFIKH